MVPHRFQPDPQAARRRRRHPEVEADEAEGYLGQTQVLDRTGVSRHHVRGIAEKQLTPPGAKQAPSLAGRPEFACEPAHRVRFHRVDDHGNLFGPLAGGALERALF